MNKYYIIKSMIGRFQCYWDKETKRFSSIKYATKYQTEEEAEKDLVEFASFVEPSHILEINDNGNK